jgi:hypothetical protein
MLCPWSSSKALNYMTQRSENVLSFSRPPAPDCGATALNLVHQAAEIFSSIEDHARETEARAQSLCESAVERLKGAECARLEIINEADRKLQEAAIALKDAQSRTVAAEDKLTAVEFRAQAAELEAREAKQALALVEEAIRRRLLCASPEAASQLNAVA